MGGVERDPMTIHAHSMQGAASEELLHNTVAMTMTAQSIADTLLVRVKLTNVGAGHHVPTDHPGRHMILTVVALDRLGQPLQQTGGSSLPQWSGAQAGQPGKAYAKLLRDAVTAEYPVVSYWKQTYILSDNRLRALESDTSAYTFRIPPGGSPVTVMVRLLFRRNFQQEMDARGWNVPDILMEEAQVNLTVPPWWNYYFPLVVR
jgi:hypothetical protein